MNMYFMTEKSNLKIKIKDCTLNRLFIPQAKVWRVVILF